MPNFNLGLTLKPLPNGSVYAAYATSSNPVGAEFDGTSRAIWRPGAVAERQSEPDLRAREEQGDRSRHQMGAVRPALAGDGGVVPDRKGKRARIAEHHQRASRDRDPGCPYTAGTSGNVSCITAGAAYRIRGIDLGVGGKITDKWSVFGGLVLMQSEVTKSLVPSPQPLLYPDQCRAQARQRRASVVQPVEQVPAHRRLGARRAGGVPLGDVRRHVPRRQPGHVDPELLALRCLRGSQGRQELDGKAVRRTTSPTSCTTMRCIRARRRSCSWRRAAA